MWNEKDLSESLCQYFWEKFSLVSKTLLESHDINTPANRKMIKKL
jgi:hypothetical protein